MECKVINWKFKLLAFLGIAIFSLCIILFKFSYSPFLNSHKWTPYVHQSRDLNKIVKQISSIGEFCNMNMLKSNLTLIEILELKICPNNEKVLPKTLILDKSPSKDYWGNMLILDSENKKIISCGAEWISVDLLTNEKFPKTLIKKGVFPPKYNDIK